MNSNTCFSMCLFLGSTCHILASRFSLSYNSKSHYAYLSIDSLSSILSNIYYSMVVLFLVTNALDLHLKRINQQWFWCLYCGVHCVLFIVWFLITHSLIVRPNSLWAFLWILGCCKALNNPQRSCYNYVVYSVVNVNTIPFVRLMTVITTSHRNKIWKYSLCGFIIQSAFLC